MQCTKSGAMTTSESKIFKPANPMTTKQPGKQTRKYEHTGSKRSLPGEKAEAGSAYKGSQIQQEKPVVVYGEDENQESSAREGALKITLHILRNMNQKELTDTLENNLLGELAECQPKLNFNKRKFE